MLKYTETNLDKKKSLVKAHEANVKAKKLATKRKVDTPPPPPPPPPPPQSKGEPTKDTVRKNCNCLYNFLWNRIPIFQKESGLTSSTPSSSSPPSSGAMSPSSTSNAQNNEKSTRSSSRKSSKPTSMTAKKNAKRVQVRNWVIRI